MKNTKAPRATLPKRMMHTFYLVQPVLQFVALLSMILVLSRCSPLAPSTEKTVGGPKATVSKGDSSNSENLLREDALRFEEIANEPINMVSEEVYKMSSEGALDPEQSVREHEMKSRLEKRRKKRGPHGLGVANGRLVKIHLNAEQRRSLFQDGVVRIDLAEYLQAGYELNARKLLFRDMQAGVKELRAHSFLVMQSEHAAPQEESLSLKISFASLGEEKAYLEIRRGAEDAQAAMQLASLDGVRKLAVVLE